MSVNVTPSMPKANARGNVTLDNRVIHLGNLTLQNGVAGVVPDTATMTTLNWIAAQN